MLKTIYAKVKVTEMEKLLADCRKAVKATAILFPLLGLTNVGFFVEPRGGGSLLPIYRISNAVLQSSQVAPLLYFLFFFIAEI